MKRISSFTGYWMLIWIIIFLLFDSTAYSQEENATAPCQNDELILRLQKSGLKLTMCDTVQPTISNSGQGLLVYKCTYIRISEKHDNYYPQTAGRSTVVRVYYDESDSKALRNQMRLIDEKYHYQLKEQKKLKNMDLNLGEVIKGFYIQPPF